MSDMPSKVTAISYVVPLSAGDRVIGKVTVNVEKPVITNNAAYIRTVLNEASLELEITDHEFQNMLGKKLLSGISIVTEEE